MSEFDGMEFGAGTVKGVRSFSVDGWGRLTGVNYPAPWKPGVNESECLERTDYMAQLGMVIGVRVPNDALRRSGRPPHALTACRCGFYAYYDGSDDYKADARISAVVEGFGETLIGSRGFRSRKARILALCIPAEPHGKPAGWLLRVWRSTVTRNFLAADALLNTLLSVLGFLQGRLFDGAFSAACAVLMTAAYLFCLRIRSRQQPPQAATKIPAEVIAKVRRNYPAVPFFTSFTSMLDAFPPDTGVEPSPDTDGHFWDLR